MVLLGFRFLSFFTSFRHSIAFIVCIYRVIALVWNSQDAVHVIHQKVVHPSLVNHGALTVVYISHDAH